jgi:hypothetical protein
MTERALKDLGEFDLRAGGWWLLLLYRRPKRFQEALEALPKERTLSVGITLATYALFYTYLIVAVGRLVLFGGFGLPFRGSAGEATPLLLAHATALAAGIGIGCLGAIITGTVVRFSAGFTKGITSGINMLLTFGVGLGITRGITAEYAVGTVAGTVQGLGVGIAEAVGSVTALGVAGVMARGVGFGFTGALAFGVLVYPIWIAGGICGGVAGAIAIVRAYYYPWHLMLLALGPTATAYRRHPAAWDDVCLLPFVGLNRFLLALWDADPKIGEQEIERLISSYPSQRMEALRARVAVIARQAGASYHLARLDDIVNRMPEGEKRFLAETPRVREMVAGIAEAQRRVDSVDRPFLREPYAEALVSKIEAFHGQIGGFHEPLASEFRNAADAWLKRAQAQLEQIKKITGREPMPQVFRAGDPVDRSQEAFVPRMGVIGQVERQVTLATGCPSLLIYGRRRMGKSTLIRNLDAFVPESVRIANVSMQDPKLFSSTNYFVREIDEKLRAALNDKNAALGSENLGGLFESLTSANSSLEKADRRLILAIDEFENIDAKIGEGVFSSDLLATIRESIQSHRRLIWLFAGSHRVAMLKNAEWSSYLISAQTIEIPPFSEAETRLLLTDPLQRSPLYAKDAERRPRFDASFWGEGGIAWIHAQTAGWPHLVQLLASEAVDYANESETARLDGRALEEVARRAIVSGDMVLRQLVRGESQSDAERAYIAGFRSKDSQPPPEDEAAFQSLRNREIMAEEGGEWRLKVPLMQQWLRARG